MLNVDINEKWVRTQNIICLADLALRWRYWALFKILLHMGSKRLPVYLWQEDAQSPDGRKFNRIHENVRTDFQWLLSQMPFIIFLRSDVEAIENEAPEYEAFREPPEGQHELLHATTSNVLKLIPCILRGWAVVRGKTEKLQREIREFEASGTGELVGELLSELDMELDAESIFPVFMKKYQDRIPFTTFELAKEFIKLCEVKNRTDQVLALIELNTRFPGLTQEQIAELLPPQSGITNQDSLNKHVYRLRLAAYKYANIPFDAPVH